MALAKDPEKKKHEHEMLHLNYVCRPSALAMKTVP
jgi:hypothetical protein